MALMASSTLTCNTFAQSKKNKKSGTGKTNSTIKMLDLMRYCYSFVQH